MTRREAIEMLQCSIDMVNEMKAIPYVYNGEEWIVSHPDCFSQLEFLNDLIAAYEMAIDELSEKSNGFIRRWV